MIFEVPTLGSAICTTLLHVDTTRPRAPQRQSMARQLTAALIVCSKSPEDHAADAERGGTDEAREASGGRIDDLTRVNGEGQHRGVLHCQRLCQIAPSWAAG